MRLLTGDRVQPQHVEACLRQFEHETPLPESDLLQSLANRRGAEGRKQMLSAMRLAPFGRSSQLLKGDTLLIDLLSNKELECVEWEAAAAGDVERGERDVGREGGAGGRQIPLIRLHVLVGELKED